MNSSRMRFGVIAARVGMTKLVSPHCRGREVEQRERRVPRERAREQQQRRAREAELRADQAAGAGPGGRSADRGRSTRATSATTAQRATTATAADEPVMRYTCTNSATTVI